jgi:hypothetical protein
VRWFSRSTPLTEPARPPGHCALALKALLDGLHPESRPAVLDLGPPLASNVKFLSALSCRVRVADLLRSLSSESLDDRRPEAMAALYERLLPFAPDERFDALLAWDVFDYMRRDQVASLMTRLTPVCGPDALAHVLVSTRSQIPVAPMRYRILDRESLAVEGRREPVRASSRYTQSDLGRMMPGFTVRRSFLLRNGIQEYLLAHGGAR